MKECLKINTTAGGTVMLYVALYNRETNFRDKFCKDSKIKLNNMEKLL